MIGRFFSTWLLASLMMLAGELVFAKDLHLMIFVPDGGKALSKSFLDQYEGEFRRNFPRDELRIAVIDPIEDSASLEKAKTELAFITGSSEQFKSLSFFSHGETHAGKNFVGKDAHYIWGLGVITKNSISVQLAEFLAPLRGRFQKDSYLFFNTCESMCGKRPKQVARRFQSVVQYLGMSNVKILGSRYSHYTNDLFQDSMHTSLVKLEASMNESLELQTKRIHRYSNLSSGFFAAISMANLIFYGDITSSLLAVTSAVLIHYGLEPVVTKVARKEHLEKYRLLFEESKLHQHSDLWNAKRLPHAPYRVLYFKNGAFSYHRDYHSLRELLWQKSRGSGSCKKAFSNW